MSEYQYYEFLSIDRPLGKADREALRALSTRARITAMSFTNTYEWGDFKGDPAKLMEHWFDLHLYLANWGTRRLMMRLPKRLLDLSLLETFLGEVDWVKVRVAGDNLILDILRHEMDIDDGGDEGSGWLAALAPLRADVFAGDLRFFYLLWLTAVGAGAFEADAPEPMPGIGPLSGALEAFVEFFGIDADLVQAAAEGAVVAIPSAISLKTAHGIISAMADSEKTGMLARVFDGDPHVTAELRAKVRDHTVTRAYAPPATSRTVGELLARAAAIGLAREQEAAKKLAAEQKRQAKEAEKARQARLVAIAQRGESAWRDVAAEIERRNAAGYDKAVELLLDLRVLAKERGTMPSFEKRLRTIREQHVRKRQFVERLAKIE